MADEFHASLCSTMSWWNTVGRNSTSSFDSPQSITCSTAIRDIANESTINWAQPGFLPLELNQMQTEFGDSLLPGLQFDPLLDPLKDIMNDSWPNSNPSPHQVPRVSSSSPKQQLYFNNNTPFWSPSASPPLDESFKRSESKKRAGDHHQHAAKKPRISAPSPLPTFKVRKEKLGDRITALQQLVSPFGKTDTASVLHEAIEYIKFLHGQVDALSSPYLKNGHQESSKSSNDHDLLSRGLCLVPISSTFAVASETPMEFWAPAFLGSYM